MTLQWKLDENMGVAEPRVVDLTAMEALEKINWRKE